MESLEDAEVCFGMSAVLPKVFATRIKGLFILAQHCQNLCLLEKQIRDAPLGGADQRSKQPRQNHPQIAEFS